MQDTLYKQIIKSKTEMVHLPDSITNDLHTHAVTGAIGGSVATIAGVYSSDLIRTLILATVGSLVSFGMSILLKWIFGKKKGKK